MKHLLQIIIVAIFISGCQEEYENITEPDTSAAISADDNIANLILKVTMKDGSFDNLIDECSEISIKFPYTVSIDDDNSMVINTMEDIEFFYINYFQYHDDIALQYPITVIFSDYSEAVLYNEDELEDIQDRYNNQFIDDDIECIDIVYPVEINVYNTTFQITDYLLVESDAVMNDLFQDLTGIILEIEFPVQLITPEGEIIIANDNTSLETQIENHKQTCDENDNIEFEDDDNPFYEIISSGSWKVSTYFHINDQTILFNPFALIFNSSYSVTVSGNESVIEGSWEYDAEGIVSIELETEEAPLAWLDNDWEVVKISKDEIQLQCDDDEDNLKKLILQILK